MNSVDDTWGVCAQVSSELFVVTSVSQGTTVDQVEVLGSNWTKHGGVVSPEGLDQCSCVDPILVIKLRRNPRGVGTSEFLDSADLSIEVEQILSAIAFGRDQFRDQFTSSCGTISSQRSQDQLNKP